VAQPYGTHTEPARPLSSQRTTRDCQKQRIPTQPRPELYKILIADRGLQIPLRSDVEQSTRTGRRSSAQTWEGLTISAAVHLRAGQSSASQEREQACEFPSRWMAYPSWTLTTGCEAETNIGCAAGQTPNAGSSGPSLLSATHSRSRRSLRRIFLRLGC